MAVHAALWKSEELGQETIAKSRQERGNKKCKLKTSLGHIRIRGYKNFWWFKCKIRSEIDQLGLVICLFRRKIAVCHKWKHPSFKLSSGIKIPFFLLLGFLFVLVLLLGFLIGWLGFFFCLGFPNPSTGAAVTLHLLIKIDFFVLHIKLYQEFPYWLKWTVCIP